MPIQQLDLGRGIDFNPLGTIGRLASQRKTEALQTEESGLTIEKLRADIAKAKQQASEDVAVKQIVSQGGDPQAVYQKLLSVNPDKARAYLTSAQADIDAQRAEDIKNLELMQGQSGGTVPVRAPAAQPMAIPSTLDGSGATQTPPAEVLPDQSIPKPLPSMQVHGRTGTLTVTPQSAEQRTAVAEQAAAFKARQETAAKIAEQQAAESGRAADAQSKTVETGDGVFQWNPATKKYDIRVGDSKAKSTKALQSKDVVLKNGSRAMVNFDPQGGKYTDAGGNDVSAQIAGDYHVPQQPSVAIVQSVDDQGNKVTKLVPKVAGTEFAAAPTAQEQNRRDQAAIIQREVDRISKMIDANPNAVGPIMGRLAKGEAVLGTISPEAKALGTALGSFVALQPVLHGFRGGGQTVDHFVGVLGDQHLNAAALKASLEQIKALAADIEHGKVQEEPAGTAAPAKTVKFSDLPK